MGRFVKLNRWSEFVKAIEFGSQSLKAILNLSTKNQPTVHKNTGIIETAIVNCLDRCRKF